MISNCTIGKDKESSESFANILIVDIGLCI